MWCRALMSACVLSLAMVAGPAAAWWHLWQEVEPAPEEQVVSQKTVSARDSVCRAGDGVHVRFGTSGFMRGSLDASAFTERTRARLAAAHVAQDEATMLEILAPLLEDASPLVRNAAILHQASWALARPQWTQTSLGALKTMLEDPGLEGYADAAYLRSVIALRQKRWQDVERHAVQALEIEPNAYDAQVMLALSQVRRIETRRLSCGQAIRQTQEAIVPVLRAGACPTHVAHLDLALQRFAQSGRNTDGHRNDLLQAIVLAYVARNDLECRRLLDTLASGPYGSECAQVVSSFPCSDQ